MLIRFRAGQRLHRKRINQWLYFFTEHGNGKLPALNYNKTDLKLLDFDSEGRGVYLDQKNRTVVKFNNFRSVRTAIKSRLALNKSKYSLKEEFENLLQLPHVDFVPEVYAYAVFGGFLSKKEKLIINFFENSMTVDQYVENGGDAKDVVVKVAELFVKAWLQGFAHMDPHPKNILIVDGEYKLIDFECCKIDPDCQDFYFGFSLGYFYHFWFNKFLSEAAYDEVALAFVNKNNLFLHEEKFIRFYEHFKRVKVSRRKRYRAFSDAALREAMIC